MCRIQPLAVAALLLVSASSALADPSAALPWQKPVEDGVTGRHVLVAVGYLLLVAALGFGLVLALRRQRGALGPATGTASVTLVSRARITPAVSVVVIEVEGRRILMAIHPAGATMLPLPHGKPDDAL